MRFNGICLVSRNVRRLRDFYVKVLQTEPSGDGDWWVDFVDVAGASFTMFNEEGMEEMAPGCMKGSGNGRYTIEFEVEDVDVEYERLKKLNVEFVKPPTTQTWGRQSVWFRDPDGNIVNFYTDVEES